MRQMAFKYMNHTRIMLRHTFAIFGKVRENESLPRIVIHGDIILL